LLHRWQDRDRDALEAITPLVYRELRRIAARGVALTLGEQLASKRDRSRPPHAAEGAVDLHDLADVYGTCPVVLRRSPNCLSMDGPVARGAVERDIGDGHETEANGRHNMGFAGSSSIPDGGQIVTFGAAPRKSSLPGYSDSYGYARTQMPGVSPRTSRPQDLQP
jgi:hypothetical protein